MTPTKGNREAIGSISLEARGADRLALGFVLTPEAWGKGLATEAVHAMIEAGFGLAPAVEILASVMIENAASQAVLEKSGFVLIGAGLQGAPARGGMAPCRHFRLTRDAWAEGLGPRDKASASFAGA
jgi:RimJ/RimL family protein N-acetyltransferase